MKNQNHNYKEEMEHTKSAAKPVLSGLLVGSVVGAAAALLFAPRSGEETRAGIRNKALEVRDQATTTVKDTVAKAQAKVDDVKDNVRGKIAGLKDRGRYTVTRQLDRVSHAAEVGKQKVQEY